MTDLANYQFEILPDVDAEDGFVFGIGAPVSLNEDGFDPGETSYLTQDSDNTRRGTKAFGRDIATGKTWLWGSHTDVYDAEAALDLLDDFSAAWKPDAARDPGWVTAVRYRLGGRYRRVFGRPRRYAAPPTNLILGGFVPITHDFQCVDDLTYSDEVSSAEIPYISTIAGGGLRFPVRFPVVTQPSTGSGSQQVTVGGNTRTYPVIRFNGPWVNPVLETDDWTLRWTGSIPANGWVEIDARPWMLTVLDHTGASRVRGLDPSFYLEDAWFAAKSSPQISLGGVASSGAASATVSWRDAWTSI